MVATSPSWKSDASGPRFSRSWAPRRPASPTTSARSPQPSCLSRGLPVPLSSCSAVEALRNLRGRWLLIRFSLASYRQDPTSCCRQNLTGKTYIRKNCRAPIAGCEVSAVHRLVPRGNDDTLQPGHQQRGEGAAARGGHVRLCARGRLTRKSL